MKRRLFLSALIVYILALAVALFFANPPAPTCACTPPPGSLPDYTVADRTNAAEVVLEGTVIALTDADYYPIMKATVKVHQYFKGGSGPVIVTITGFGPSSLCLSWVNVGERWVFYATGNPSSGLEAHYLSQFDAVDPADPQTIAEVIAAVGQDPVLPFGYYVYLPVISVGEPAPYNLKAEDLVLQPSDIPSGYELDRMSRDRLGFHMKCYR